MVGDSNRYVANLGPGFAAAQHRHNTPAYFEFLRRCERYRPNSPLKGVPFGCRYGVPIQRRLTLWTPRIQYGSRIFECFERLMNFNEMGFGSASRQARESDFEIAMSWCWMNGLSTAAAFEGEFSNVRDSYDSARSSSDCNRTSRRRRLHWRAAR